MLGKMREGNVLCRQEQDAQEGKRQCVRAKEEGSAGLVRDGCGLTMREGKHKCVEGDMEDGEMG